MPIDPNIAMGYRGIELQNPLAQYGQIAAIQNAQNQNALAQLQMREAEAIAQEKNMLRRLDPTASDYEAQLFKVNPQLGINYRKEAATTAAQKAAETKSLIEAAASKQKLLGQALRDISGRPSDANITAHTEDIQASPLFSAEEKAKALVTQQTLLAIPFAERQAYFASQGATASELKPTLTSQDFGGGKRIVTTPAFGGATTVSPGSEITKTQTFADITAAKQATTSAGQLNLAREKFAFEQANPTLSIQQTPTGYVAVNTTNGMAIPVLYGQAGFQAAGGAQPAAAPGTSMMRQPPAALPGQRTPVIPGMASVLDQTAAPSVAPTAAPMALPVGTPGTPVMGKQSELKPIPSNINLAILKNNQSIQQIDETIKLLQQNPSATGVKGYLPGFALNRMDPSGVEARAGVADIGSLVLHDRSGAAVTAAEAPRLVPFIPLPTDDNATVIKKLTRMRNIAAQEQTGLTETYGKDQGYAPNPTVGKTGGAPLSAQQIPPIYATNGKERIMSIDGGQTWTPANK